MTLYASSLTNKAYIFAFRIKMFRTRSYLSHIQRYLSFTAYPKNSRGLYCCALELSQVNHGYEPQPDIRPAASYNVEHIGSLPLYTGNTTDHLQTIQVSSFSQALVLFALSMI